MDSPKYIEGYEGRYSISESGEIYSHKSSKYLKPIDNGKGYLFVQLWSEHTKSMKMHKIHRLVWQTFVGKIPEHLEVDHINEDKSDNRLCNLQLLSQAENKTKSSSKFWIVTAPDGDPFGVHNLRKFCRDNDLSYTSMCGVAYGRYGHYRGWEVIHESFD